MLEGYQEIRQNEFRNHAELIRLQTAKLVNMSGRSLEDGETVTPAELWRYEWDAAPTDTEDKSLTTEQVLEHNNRLAAMMQ